MAGVVMYWLFVASVGLVILLLVVAVRHGNLYAAYHHLARQYAGVVEKRRWFEPPVVYFTHGEMAATVTVVRPHGMGGPLATQVVVRDASNPDPNQKGNEQFRALFFPHTSTSGRLMPFTCEITPAGILKRLACLVVRRGMLTDSREFELTYQVDTDSREHARRLLTRYVQVAIDRLRYFQGGNDIYLLFDHGEMTVRRRGILRNERALQQFVALTLELYDHAIASYGVGVDFIEASLQTNGQAVCKVCGDSLDNGEVVYCRLCNTPHHRDCWRYFGGCSTYACGERRFDLAPRLARDKA